VLEVELVLVKIGASLSGFRDDEDDDEATGKGDEAEGKCRFVSISPNGSREGILVSWMERRVATGRRWEMGDGVEVV